MIPPFLSIFILVAFFASILLADDFKTIYGKEYKNAQVTRVEPDGIIVKTKSGLSKIYFTELPKEVQDRFHYDPQQAAQYSAQTFEEIKIARQQKVEQDQKRANEIARNLEIVRQQQQAEMQHQERIAERQSRQQAAKQQRQVQTNTQPTYSRSQEGIPEHTYELTQDYKLVYAGLTIRFRRGEQYHGRILVDHAEVDKDGRSWTVPSGILRKID